MTTKRYTELQTGLNTLYAEFLLHFSCNEGYVACILQECVHRIGEEEEEDTFITSAEREVKVSRCSEMYQSYNFLTRLGKQSLYVFGSIRLFDEVRAELVRDISRSLRFL